MTETRKTLASRLIGAWELVSYSEINAETNERKHPMGEHPTGFILYTHDGYMSAQIQGAGRSLFADNDMFRGKPEEYTASGKSYLAYSGPYRADEATSTVTHLVEVSLFPNWINKDQVRMADFPDGNLRLRFDQPQRSNGALITAELVWARCVSQSVSA